MALAKITLGGFEQYMRDQESTSLFSEITLPESLDKDLLIDNILFDLGEMEVLYSQPFFYKSAINNFFLKYNQTFTKWVKAFSIEYNPLENYDRRESWTDTGNASSTQSGTITGNSTDSSRSSTENRVSAYDSSNYQPESQNGFTGEDTTTTNNTSDSNTSSTNSGSHEGRLHGNIGVTTSQQMLISELDLYKGYNIYKMITDLFAQELCLLVY